VKAVVVGPVPTAMSVRTLLSALNPRPTAMSVMTLVNDIAVGTELASDCDVRHDIGE
jgi:hypothetical protein